MSSVSKKDNKELENEQKQIHHKPEDLMDTDVEAEFQEGEGKEKGRFRQQTGKPSSAKGQQGGGSSAGGGKPSNEQLEKEQKQTKLSPDELKDTDVEDEFKEGGQKGFRQQSGTSGTSVPSSNDKMETGKQMKMAPDEVKDAESKSKQSKL